MNDNEKFLLGLALGVFLRWSDVVPLVAGIVIGFTVQKVPDVITTSELPKTIQSYVQQLKKINNSN